MGGLFWNVAFDGDIVSRPCRNIDSIFRYEHYYNTYYIIIVMLNSHQYNYNVKNTHDDCNIFLYCHT